MSQFVVSPRSRRIIWQLLAAAVVWTAGILNAQTPVTLDARFFPATAADQPPLVLQGNWQGETTLMGDAGTPGAPTRTARLFGTAGKGDHFDLYISYNSASQIHVWSASNQQWLAPTATPDGHGGTLYKLLFPIVADSDDGTWKWEEAFRVGDAPGDQDAPSPPSTPSPTPGQTSTPSPTPGQASPPTVIPGQSPAPVGLAPPTVWVNIANGNVVRTFMLGDCWLIAGGWRAGERITKLSATKGMAALDLQPNGVPLVLSASASGDMAATTNPVPALAWCVVDELAQAADGAPARATSAYVWTRPRTLISAWLHGDKLGAIWDQFGQRMGDSAKIVRPGLRGVIWAHGEWDAERGNFRLGAGAGTQMPSGEFTVKFADAYKAALVTLARAAREDFSARQEKSALSTDDAALLSNSLAWVVLQAPDVGRKAEFYDVFQPGFKDELAADPGSAWNALRLAQFGAVEELCVPILGSSSPPPAPAPATFIVGLLGSGGMIPDALATPGWVWTTSGTTSARARYREAARRAAAQVCALRLPRPFSTGPLPSIRLQGTKPVLALAGVDPSGKRPGLTLSVGPAALEYLTVDAQQVETWQAAILKRETTFPDNAKAVRYAAGESPGAVAALTGGDGIVPLPLPAFQLLVPTPTPTPTPSPTSTPAH